jgi:hypothetical protein
MGKLSGAAAANFEHSAVRNLQLSGARQMSGDHISHSRPGCIYSFIQKDFFYYDHLIISKNAKINMGFHTFGQMIGNRTFPKGPTIERKADSASCKKWIFVTGIVV